MCRDRNRFNRNKAGNDDDDGKKKKSQNDTEALLRKAQVCLNVLLIVFFVFTEKYIVYNGTRTGRCWTRCSIGLKFNSIDPFCAPIV